MTLRCRTWMRGPWSTAIPIAVVTVVFSLAATAAETTKTKPSLQSAVESLAWIPDDAAVYGAVLRGRERFDAVAGSRAWAKLWAMPSVQSLWEMYQSGADEPGSPMGKVHMALADPQIQDLLALLADMFSDEAFVYGDEDTVSFLHLMQRINSAMSYGPAMVQLDDEELTESEAQMMVLTAALDDNLDALKLPGVLAGFKLRDPSRAMINLGKLEMIVGILLKQMPQYADSFRRTKIGGYEYLVLTLKGDMVPWESLPLDQLRAVEVDEGSVDRIVEKLQEETLTLAIGLRGDFLITAIGSSTEVLERLGDGEPLADRPELAPLARFADRRITSIGYVSEAMAEVANDSARNIDDLLEFATEWLPEAELDEADEDALRDDAEALAEDVKHMLPEPGAGASIGFLTDQGIESYAYQWGVSSRLDSSSPLGLLRHVGGSPVLAAVSRSNMNVEDYDRAARWVGVGYGYFKKYGLLRMEQAKREKFERYAEWAVPMIQRAHQTTRELFLPALDGQCGMVVDARLTSKQILDTMPAMDKPMPMPEPAIVLGVSDARQMREALAAYGSIIAEALAAAGQDHSDAAMLVGIEPQSVTSPLGELFVFTPPESCPVDKQVTPTVGLGEHVCVFAATQSHAERLLKPTPLSIGGVLAETDRPLAMAVCFDWTSLLAAARPWSDIAVDRILADQMSPDEAKTSAPSIKEQVRTVLDVLGAIRSITSETYAEDDATVTHTLIEIHDIK